MQQAFAAIESLSKSMPGLTLIVEEMGLCSMLDPGPAQTRLLALWIENAYATLGRLVVVPLI